MGRERKKRGELKVAAYYRRFTSWGWQGQSLIPLAELGRTVNVMNRIQFN